MPADRRRAATTTVPTPTRHPCDPSVTPRGHDRHGADVYATDRAGRRWLAGLALVLAHTLGDVIGAPPARAQNQAQPQLPTVTLTAGIHRVRAEVADSFDTRMRGLMFRDRLGPNEGMLFVFQDRSEQCFWMKNTTLPLSIAFIDDDGTIVNIADMKPLDERSHCSAKPVRFTLEMEQGWFAKRGIKAGARLGGEQVFRAAR